MKSSIFLAVILLSSNLLYSQEQTTWDVYGDVTLRANLLIDNGKADKVIIFAKGSYGGASMSPKYCDCSDGDIIAYLIRHENRKSFIKRVECCGSSYWQPFNFKHIWRDFDINKRAIATSKFESKYLEVHSNFVYLKFISKADSLEIRTYSYYFDEENEFRTQNEELPAKIFIDELRTAIELEEKRGFVVEH